MFAARITSPQRAVAALRKAAMSAGEPPAGCMLMVARRARISGRAKTSFMAALILSTIAFGVLGGAAIAFQVSERTSGTPASAMVGISGSAGSARSTLTATLLVLPAA